jgi:hypothetical protein
MAVPTEEELKKLTADQQKMNALAFSDPSKLVTAPVVTNMTVDEDQLISAGTGQVTGPSGYTPVTAGDATTASTPVAQDAVTFDSVKVTPDVQQHLDTVQAAQGTVSPQSTVQGQMANLMAQFEGGETPPWAAGAIRNANAKMQSRGLGASSMAGGAITQAAMESALPIAAQDANVFAQMDFANLSNRQQTTLYKSQQIVAGMFNDQAAENVERQINAASKNQVTQFYASLHSQVEQFNSAQINAMKQFNAGETNVAERFNAELDNARQVFNAQNSLIIAQANAKWRQDVDTINTATQNAANMETAKAANGITDAALNALWQRERDLIAFAFQASESKAERDLNLFLANKQQKFLKSQANAERDAENKRGIGQIVGTIGGKLLENIF